MSDTTRSRGVVLAAVLVSLLATEVAARLIDGYPLQLRLAPRSPRSPARAPISSKWLEPSQARFYVDRLPIAAGANRAWFLLDPPAPGDLPVDPVLLKRSDVYQGFGLSSEYEWNRQYVQRICDQSLPQQPVFSRVDDLFMFDPPNGDRFPVFRFLRNAHYPSGLQTNAFGWRGPDITLNKPAGTVRIAFVGASTTIDPHGDRFSYPEYLGVWLNEWGKAHGGVRFETINAGREGVSSNSIAAIVEQELTPVRPDLVVYYEGSNQFWPRDFVDGDLPPRSSQSAKPPSLLEQYSAVASRVFSAWKSFQEQHEPKKPGLTANWPKDLSEEDPPLDDPRLPLQLPSILHDLDRIKTVLSAYGGTLMPSSFIWLVYDGLVLDRQRDAGVYSYLNETFWPFRYGHMRRMVDFQNRVFRKYATVHGLPFNDLAATYPSDPRLFFDAVHMTPAGIKLKAWLVFQQLTAEIERRLVDGRLPLADPGGRTAHPAFNGRPPALVRLDDIRNTCAAPRSQ